LVGAALALAVHTVVQTNNAKDIFFNLAGEVLGDGNFEALDIGLLLFVQASCLRDNWCDSQGFPLLTCIYAIWLNTTNKVNFIGN
jgi:hypothetical protein